MSGAPPRTARRMRAASRMSASSKRGAARDRGAEVLAPAAREVVDDGHLVAAIEERVDEVGADEAGAAGDQGTHGGGSYARTRARRERGSRWFV